MSIHIITSVRQLPQLKGSLLLTALELAHRADGYNGCVSVAYSYLASKTHQSRRTAIRHIKRLIALGIITAHSFPPRRQRSRWLPRRFRKRQRAGATPYKWGVNRYRFIIAWEKSKPWLRYAKGRQNEENTPAPPSDTAQKSIGDTVALNLPALQTTAPILDFDREKWGSLADEERRKSLVLSWLSPGSQAWDAVQHDGQ